MATGQYLTEVALELTKRGHRLTVLSSRRAYDDPATTFPARETWRGIEIHRIGSTGFGKGARWRRVADFASFTLFCALRLLFLPRHDVVVALTSPPLISFIGAWLAKLRRAQFVYWVMDFNPDEAIVAGWLRPNSFAAKVLEAMSRFSLRRATRIIALDRFMLDRIVAKGISAEKVAVIPPWSHDDAVRYDPAGRERFRKAHGLDGKFVVMYSGNHSPCHPLDTLLAAAQRLSPNNEIIFCFVGGGSEFRKIEATIAATKNVITLEAVKKASKSASKWDQNDRQLPSKDSHGRQLPQNSNLLCLPYQPLNQLSASLSAADLHVVVMGNNFVGLVHPCKIYNILSVGAPVLYIGPTPSHVSEILHDDSHLSASVSHGNVDKTVAAIERVKNQIRSRPSKIPAAPHSQETLLPELIEALESGK
jgi:glycosyltransferase involved in cell wall biosynthesis